jgi:imidazolonepropionase-like amidohydrolase
MKKVAVFIIASMFCFSHAWAQETFPYNGVKDFREKAYAFTNATIHVDYQTILDSATLLIREGKVVSTGKGINIPSGFSSIDCEGKHIYPSFIDLNSNYGFVKSKLNINANPNQFQIEPLVPGAYNANDAINSYVDASDYFVINKNQAAEYRKSGFGTVLSANQDGIARGTSTLVLLQDENENESILIEKAGAHYSFNKGSSQQTYPASLMGSVALLRQTFLDAKWYAEAKPYTDLSLQSWNENQSRPQFFDARGKYGILRADKVGDEFGVQYIINSSGSEYQNIDEIKNTGATLVVSINFPKPYNVEDPLDALEVSLTQMKHWELAPYNLKILAENNINFALSSSGLKSKNDFMENLRKAISVGLSKEQALKSLTSTPAKLVLAENQIGSLKTGYIANFIITDQDIFEEKSIILENWVKGNKYEINKEKLELDEGEYELSLDAATYKVEFKKDKFQIIVNDSTKKAIQHKLEEKLITLNFEQPDTTLRASLSGWKIENRWIGRGKIGFNDWINWQLTFKKGFPDVESDTLNTEKKGEGELKEKKDSLAVQEDVIGDIFYPFSAYGQKELPKRQSFLIKNITAWTNEHQGITENLDVYILDGKIKKIGQGLAVKNATVIDGTGKHLTPGIVDEHSHIGIFQTNDRATNSGMVRIEDVINPEQINLYGQLAGGVTSAQLLHGSANPIGGQSAIIKLKWGESVSNMLIKDADPFIKFALGENVKRSNWGNDFSNRYPQTRMGVEQVYIDAFTNALEYEKSWKTYNQLSGKSKLNNPAPRRDLLHETMLEILRKKRFVTCHSYVQSEINMLMKVAEKFDFNINTFTHIMEGYKVADKMKAHGVGASTFSDWWGYKWEVRYAIPYNAALMHNEGVVVAINSDDVRSASRLNQEAAKTIKYGGISDEDALKMITLNPAKLLHLDDKIGSIKVGKDADLVIWSDNPMSVYAKAEMTIIEGSVYFDIKKDEEMQKVIKAERARLIAKMKDAKLK